MLRNNRWKRNRRIVLFQKQGGLCFWCKKPMEIFDQPGGRLPAHACTLDHVFPRSDPRRNNAETWSGQRLVAACFLCNNKRGDQTFERTFSVRAQACCP